ncbi:MAG: hypothetical protein AAGG01_08690 [Planctomycetota bacterium]
MTYNATLSPSPALRASQALKAAASLSLGSLCVQAASAQNPALTVDGPAEIVIDWSQPDPCMTADPYRFGDVPVNAFRTNDGNIHLRWGHGGELCFLSPTGIGAAYELVGPDFNSLVDTCQSTFLSSFDHDHKQFNDQEWLQSYWLEQKTSGLERVAGLIHMEYHSECLTTGLGINAELNPRSITLASSTDGGASFQQAPSPRQLVATTPYRWIPSTPNIGNCEGPTNILEKDGYYYSMFRFSAYASASSPNPIPERLTVMRTTDPFRPGSWRAYGGDPAAQGSGLFDVNFKNPYTQTITNPQDHLPRAVNINQLFDGWGIYWSTFANQFVSIGIGRAPATGIFGIYYSYSTDMINWTEPVVVPGLELDMTPQVFASNGVAYPTLIDHDSTRVNFDWVDDTVHLYLTRLKGNAYSREMIRIPLRFL